MSTSAEPIDLVILGASGDLTHRLLLPALHRLDETGRLPPIRLIGFSPGGWETPRFRAPVQVLHLRGDLSPISMHRLAELVRGRAVFYLALPPGVFATAATGLARAGLAEPRDLRSIVVEKPFGQDLESARRLNQELHGCWEERQIFRIDHFLGKETVQNLLVFRFANGFVEPIWNAHHIAQVQITVAETLGLEGRHRYYDGIGALRDMLQNHLMQLVTLAAIEPPALWDADVLRDHKVEVLKAVRPIPPDQVHLHAARGRYRGYLDEPGVPPGSRTETFAALRLDIDSWRWKGVPFLLRSGKRLRRNYSEIAIELRSPPTRLFCETPLERAEPNWLVFRLRPDEAIDLTARAKRPGLELASRPVQLHADYARPGEQTWSAYAQLLLDVMEGDRTPFLRFDEVEWSWRVLQPVLDAWAEGEPEDYAPGSDGPASQWEILPEGVRWRSLGEDALVPSLRSALP
jgi:glucose-6-phosphate 1-dehydrogenase